MGAKRVNIAVFGKYFSNAGHGAECGIVDALHELGHAVCAVDFHANKIQYTGEEVKRLDPNSDLTETPLGIADFALIVGPGLPPDIAKQENIQLYFGSHYSVCWNSEPLRLYSYRDRACRQHDLFTLWATFDEGELSIYKDHHMEAIFLPQAFNPKWYKPLEIPPDKFVCFFGSVGGKWANREHLIRRAQATLKDKFFVGTNLFDAAKVNEAYNHAVIVLNLGLYHEELGPPEQLASYALQQRVFEAIGAGCVPMTNTPADLSMTPTQQKLFKNYHNIIYYDNDTFEATLQFYMKNPDKLAEIHKNVLKSREEHTYKARMVHLIKILEEDKKWDIR